MLEVSGSGVEVLKDGKEKEAAKLKELKLQSGSNRSPVWCGNNRGSMLLHCCVAMPIHLNTVVRRRKCDKYSLPFLN